MKALNFEQFYPIPNPGIVDVQLELYLSEKIGNVSHQVGLRYFPCFAFMIIINFSNLSTFLDLDDHARQRNCRNLNVEPEDMILEEYDFCNSVIPLYLKGYKVTRNTDCVSRKPSCISLFMYFSTVRFHL